MRAGMQSSLGVEVAHVLRNQDPCSSASNVEAPPDNVDPLLRDIAQATDPRSRHCNRDFDRDFDDELDHHSGDDNSEDADDEEACEDEDGYGEDDGAVYADPGGPCVQELTDRNLLQSAAPPEDSSHIPAGWCMLKCDCPFLISLQT